MEAQDESEKFDEEIVALEEDDASTAEFKRVEGKFVESSSYNEIFFIDQGSQSNIYCSTKLRYPSTTQERFLVGTLSGKVSCLERCEVADAPEKFHSSHDMQAREVYFSYIPGDAEIISMDAFYKHQTMRESKRLIVGVTLILLKPHNKDVPPKHFFNIYNALEPGQEFDLDKLAQVCQHQRLGFTPYHLYHANIYINGGYETVFLLAGSDQQIHVFRADDQLKFEEHPCGKYFPEFTDIPGRVIWMDVRNCESHERLSVFGCDNGYLRINVTNVRTTEVLRTWSLELDGPISSVRLFTLKAEKKDTFNELQDAVVSPRSNLGDISHMNLLVTSALEVSVVFLNVSERGLDDMVILNQSDQYDSVTCSCITDIDCDGNQEIVLGTYGQELLVYKWFAPSIGFSHLIHFDLMWQKQFCKPLLAIHGLDLMGDGMQEMVVVSLTGVHILQHEVEQAAEKLLQKIIHAFPEKTSIDGENVKPTLEKKDGVDTDPSELDEVIRSICSTNNAYNDIT